MKRLLAIALLAALINSGCAAIFLSKKQKVTVSSSSKDSKIFVNEELEGTGTAKFTAIKHGPEQIVLQTPGYKDNYCVLFATKRKPGFYVCIVADCLVPLYGWYAAGLIEGHLPKSFAYDNSTKFALTGKAVTKTSDLKYIDISKIGIDFKDKSKDIKGFKINIKNQKDRKIIDKLIEQAEAKKQKKDDKEKAQKKLSKKDTEHLKEEEEANQYDDTKFSYNLFKTLKNTGFIDTVNRVFQDQNNTLVLEGKITKINAYDITYGKRNYLWNQYSKAKVFMTWYIKNQYGEKLDSINTKEMSGDFVLYNYFNKKTHTESSQQKQVEKMIGDAIDNSYLTLYNNNSFKKYIKSEPAAITSLTNNEVLHLNRPKSVVADKGDASAASVIIKREDQGHGSGFAITEDGYILTNYHVIASEDPNKTEKIKVITSSGEELEPSIVRVSKARDLVLLKVDRKFEKAFVLSPTKQFKALEDVYTIGAPKSIELGQTVTSGMISNERNANNNELLQLSMPVNFGNSGGPLFNSNGILDGVIVSKLVGVSTEGISFAIPAYKISDYLNLSY